MNEKKVKRVEFVPTLPGMQKAVTKKIKRVAVYARVSTDHMEQQTSLAAQKDYYAKKIAEHDDWILAGIYADDGISGTSYMKREAFRKMMADWENRYDSDQVGITFCKKYSRCFEFYQKAQGTADRRIF